MPVKEAAEIEIIRLMKAGRGAYTSGQSLSSSLGISRTAVWKHIKTLKKMGFQIEASPSKGYRLTGELPFNGVEVASSLSTKFVGKNIFFYPRIDSTNIKAFELGRSGEGEGTAVIAEAQDKGKGRVGRVWESPAGLNLYTSIILRPPVAPQFAHNLTFVLAVAAAEAVGLFVKQRPTVKWPNDVLVNGRKLAGILLEMDSEPDRVHFVVAGIGVNINIRREMFPPYIKNTATSIAEERGEEAGRAEFARSLYSSIELWYKIYLDKGFLPILEAWKGYFDAEGKEVRVSSFNRAITGVCCGVDADGALLVKLSSGKVERVVSGDVETGKT
ncbi:MAG: biotin--[acetyl-CoA-carboxylase] ligase [Deltaproteobacteria bacterium]|nr:biotin--[acetyl-CoA-carboxylase] ligase [Deltaproteobacteria bacterium]